MEPDAPPEAAPVVGHLPPLGKPPDPPRLPPDPRQAVADAIKFGLVRGLLGEEPTTTDVPRTGFHAAGVHVGQLKAAMESGLVAFDMATVTARWDVDVQRWLLDLLKAWVQRWKLARLEPRDNGIAVTLETQDDLGYYTYGFDVFPGRRTSHSGT